MIALKMMVGPPLVRAWIARGLSDTSASAKLGRRTSGRRRKKPKCRAAGCGMNPGSSPCDAYGVQTAKNGRRSATDSAMKVRTSAAVTSVLYC
jgi:hypothetical protein